MKIRNGFVSNSSSQSCVVISNNGIIDDKFINNITKKLSGLVREIVEDTLKKLQKCEKITTMEELRELIKESYCEDDFDEWKNRSERNKKIANSIENGAVVYFAFIEYDEFDTNSLFCRDSEHSDFITMMD